MQMIDLMKRLAELDAKNSNIVKQPVSEVSVDYVANKVAGAMNSPNPRLGWSRAAQTLDKMSSKFGSHQSNQAVQKASEKMTADKIIPDLIDKIQSGDMKFAFWDLPLALQQDVSFLQHFADALDAEGLEGHADAVRDGLATAEKRQRMGKWKGVTEGSPGDYTFTTAINGMLGDDKEFEVTYYYSKGEAPRGYGSLPSPGGPASVEIISVKDLETGQDVSVKNVGKDISAEFEEEAWYDYRENHQHDNFQDPEYDRDDRYEGVAEGSRTAKPGEHIPLNHPARRAAADMQRKTMAAAAAAKPGQDLANKIAKKGVGEGTNDGEKYFNAFSNEYQAYYDKNKDLDPDADKALAEITPRGQNPLDIAQQILSYVKANPDEVGDPEYDIYGSAIEKLKVYVQDQQQRQSMGEGLEECGMMGGMSQPRTPASINMTAGSGEELSGMLKDIMSLAGVKPVTPQDLGHDHDPGVMSTVPGMGVASAEPESEPFDMKNMIAKIDSMNSDNDEEEIKTDETISSMPDPKIVPVPPGTHDPAGSPGAGKGRGLVNHPVATPQDTYESLMADYKKFISEN